MTKKSRLRKAWLRNYEFYMAKGVYFCQCPIKYQPTPKQLSKYLKHERIKFTQNIKRT